MGLIEQAARDVINASVFIPQKPKNSLFFIPNLVSGRVHFPSKSPKKIYSTGPF
jgi:hypothetical protein